LPDLLLQLLVEVLDLALGRAGRGQDDEPEDA
jgi:hypothetical protein